MKLKIENGKRKIVESQIPNSPLSFLHSNLSFLNSLGFTLIELLTVITIIAVLAGIGMVSFQGVQSKGRDSTRKSDLRALSSALEIYFQKNDGYIDGTPGVEGDCSGADTSALYSGITTYMANQKVPVDPKTITQYCYMSVNSGQSFRLFAKLENCSDPEVINPGSCSPTDWNFSVVSHDLAIALASGGSTPTSGPTPIPTAAPTADPTPTTPPTPTPTIPASACPTSGLVAYWKMNEASWNGTAGEVLDSAGTRHGSRVGNATTTAAGLLGRSGTFDGNGDYVNFSSTISNASFSISAWVKPAISNEDDKGIVSLWTNSATGYMQALIGGKARIYVNGTSVEGSTLLSSTTTWYHLVGTFDGTTIKVYVNNALVGSGSAGAVSTTGNAQIGTYNSRVSSSFNGFIDEVGVWSRALNTTEISTLYNSGAGLTCP